MNPQHPIATLGLFLMSAGSVQAASFLDDIGFTALKTELGAALPTGSGVPVIQVEASTNPDPTLSTYAPDPGNAEFSGKTISFPGTASVGYSVHAVGVGMRFYGNRSSTSPGVTAIKSYAATDWLDAVYGNPAALVSADRVVNHSWVGNAFDSATSTDFNGPILHRLDWLINQSQQIHVAAILSSPLLMNAYNAITVGQTDFTANHGSTAIVGDTVYGTGRAKPDIVSPFSTVSSATPVVASAAILLVNNMHSKGLSLSKGSTVVSGATVYNGERPEAIKAALLAGASRATANTVQNSSLQPPIANITDYGSVGHLAANGLDLRYGAGQLQISNSYHILDAGEQDSLEDGGTSFAGQGFDCDPAFGGLAGSNSTARYRLNPAVNQTLAASLVWPIMVASDANLTPTLRHLNLAVFDITGNAAGTKLIGSESGVDNSQNLLLKLLAGRQYEIRVSTPDAAFSWHYALAWRTVATAAASVSLSSSPSPVQAGQPVTLTATVSGSLPGGTIQFQANGLNLGAPVALVNGTASLTTTLASAGSYAITAVYSGDIYNQAGSSGVFTQTVTPAAGQQVPALPVLGEWAMALGLAGVGVFAGLFPGGRRRGGRVRWRSRS